MIAADSTKPPQEIEQLLALLSRLDSHHRISDVLADAQEICRLLPLYSFRSTQRAERLYAELSSRYRRETLFLYGHSFLLRRQSDSCYLRLEQMLPLLARVAALRLSRAGVLSLSQAQLTQSDGMLLQTIQRQAQQKADG